MVCLVLWGSSKSDGDAAMRGFYSVINIIYYLRYISPQSKEGKRFQIATSSSPALACLPGIIIIIITSI